MSWTPIRYVNRAYSRSVLAGLYRTARVGLVTPLRDGIGFGRRHSRQPLRAGGYPSLASGHHGTKLAAYGSPPTTQTERSESFETA